MPDPEPARLLILGGTAEAARLAAAVSERFGATISVTTSLAGTTRVPRAVAGTLRVGGFGGSDGLAAWLKAENVALVVDATHPFAARISANARVACDAVGVPRLLFARSPWRPQNGDNWRVVSDLDTAAALLPEMAQWAFLSVGSQRLAAFAGLSGIHLVVRMIDPPEAPLPLADCSVILGRGPFDIAAERDLLQRERIDAVVSRNSGGLATYAKIEAARGLGLPVIMVTPPPPEAGARTDSSEGALRWIEEQIASR